MKRRYIPRQKPGRSKQDYGTPWALIRAIEARWGSLTIDLAARANNAKAPAFITPEENSLIQNWNQRIGDGLAWLNPEFDYVDPWAEKCSICFKSIVMLTPASIGTEWFADYCERKSKTVALRPRVKFEGCHVVFPKGHSKARQRKCEESCLGCSSYPKDCMLSLFGPRFESEPEFQTWRWDDAMEVAA